MPRHLELLKALGDGQRVQALPRPQRLKNPTVQRGQRCPQTWSSQSLLYKCSRLARLICPMSRGFNQVLRNPNGRLAHQIIVDHGWRAKSPGTNHCFDLIFAAFFRLKRLPDPNGTPTKHADEAPTSRWSPRRERPNNAEQDSNSAAYRFE